MDNLLRHIQVCLNKLYHNAICFSMIYRCREVNQRLAVAYHQCEALYIIRNLLRYIIKPQEYAPSVMIYAFGDDIHAKA